MMLATLARRLLHLPVLRYVDDFFTAEREESAAHAMMCFARFVRMLLGVTAIEAKKLDYGPEMEILGVILFLSIDGYTCKPAARTVCKCLAVINDALRDGMLTSGQAQKLAGRLCWATQHLFNRLGRAMVRPIYSQKLSRTGHVGSGLRAPLRWWRMVLSWGIVERRRWAVDQRPPLHMYTDACSTPPRCAAVLFADQVWFCDGMCLTPRKACKFRGVCM